MTFTGTVISSQDCHGADPERSTVTSSEEPSSTVLAADSETYTDFVPVPEPEPEPVSGFSVALSSIVISAEEGVTVSQVSQAY